MSVEEHDVLSRQPESNDLIVVGIGASAGGVQALREFFEHVPEKSGIAYVVILHLSPDHDSRLAEVLQAASKNPVIKVTEKTKVKKDHVYVVPPNQHLTMVDDHIAVSTNLEVEDRRAPIDIFFRTLANSHGPRAVCVVLSGTGANGSMGLKRVKEMGGAAFVQNPREAEFNEMPRNSIATEIVDAVLPVGEVPHKIIAYKQSFGKVRIPEEPQKRPEDQQHALREIFTQLRLRTGHDFTNYKRPTLLRRIERRINVHGLPDLSSYATFLQKNPDETSALLKDLLISVTNFFRDQKAFEVVEQKVLPAIIGNKTPDQQVRIWVAGCATGEEAYSLAMLCAEQTLNVLDAPKIQIFATDIDEAAITQAREGIFTLNDAADVSPERLRRFFTKEGVEYRVRHEIREMVLFANHNFIKDPPFSNLDLISCRNVLIYLNGGAQERVMETFHFALKPGGYLFLGSSESADGANDLYSNTHREAHIFQKRAVSPSPAYPVPQSVPSFTPKPQLAKIVDEPSRRHEQVTFSGIHQRLLEQYAPPSVIVNEQYDIVHLSEKAGQYLQIRGGEPTQNLLELVRPELRLELRSALVQAVQGHTAVEARGLKVKVEDGIETINLRVRPVLREGDEAYGFFLILFESVTAPAEEKNDVVIASNDSVARLLEEELIRVKSQLRNSKEQHELHAEELRASNEELQAMNEELRSAAEELETSKEELQSINEELRTVNQELKVKVDEITISSNNLHNLINSVDIATIFLDRSLRVALFTPSARELFNLIPADFGRPLSDITGKLMYDRLTEDADLVLGKLQSVEREVRTTDGNVYTMRMLPYRTAEDRINGVVVTFFDITKRKQTEEALRASEERMRLILESARDFAIFTIDLDRKVNTWNTGAEGILGYTEEEIIGQSGDVIFTPEDRKKGAPALEVKTAADEGLAVNERWHQRKDGSLVYCSGTVRPLHDNEGKPLGFVKIMRDLTEAKRAEEARYFLASIVESTEDSVVTLNFDSVITSWNRSAENLYGLKAKEAIGKPASTITLPEELAQLLINIERIRHTQKVELYESIAIQKGGRTIHLEAMLSPVKNTSGEVIGVSVIARDVTERKKLEQMKDEFIGIASHELKTPVTSIKGYAEILQQRFEKSNQTDNVVMMQKLNRQVDRLTGLINDLLDTTRIAEGRIHLEPEEFDLNELIAENIEEMQRLSEKHQLNFKPGKIKKVMADRKRIGEALTNIISNAIKYSPGGGEVLVTAEDRGEMVKVSVADNGIGIPEHLQPKVFDRFFRVTNIKSRTFPGMGLGLYITAGIIHQHGGSVAVKSRQGKGSIFSFTLPYS